MNELQEKYVKGNLNYDEMILFLSYLDNNPNPDAPFRERRISKLKEMIIEIDRKALTKQQLEEKQLISAIAYHELTVKWEAAGAYHKPLGSVITKWYFKDQCFFTWFSGVDAIEHLKNAKQGDLEFERLRGDAVAS